MKLKSFMLKQRDITNNSNPTLRVTRLQIQIQRFMSIRAKRQSYTQMLSTHYLENMKRSSHEYNGNYNVV